MSKIKQKLVHLFCNNRVMSISFLQQQLNNRSRRSIFRDLINEGYYSSYTHAGQYYTLRHIPDFNSDGLWFYEDIGFSKYGTVKDTIIFLVNNSESGKTHGELKKLLHIRIHNALLELVKLDKLVRERCDHIYIYVSTEKKLAERQLERRRLLSAAGKSELPSELMQIRIFVEIIKCSMIDLNPEQITARLKVHGEKTSIKEVEKVLVFHGLKKN